MISWLQAFTFEYNLYRYSAAITNECSHPPPPEVIGDDADDDDGGKGVKGGGGGKSGGGGDDGAAGDGAVATRGGGIPTSSSFCGICETGLAGAWRACQRCGGATCLDCCKERRNALAGAKVGLAFFSTLFCSQTHPLMTAS